MARTGWLAIVLFAGCGEKYTQSDADSDSDSDTDSDAVPDCGALPEATAEAVHAFLEADDYRNTWPHEPASDGIRPNIRDAPHGNPLEIFVRGCVEQTWGTDAEQYPPGALVVLRGYQAGDGVTWEYVMYRTSDAAGAPGWWWAVYDAGDHTIEEPGSLVSCYGCHSSGDDFVRAFTLDGV